MPTWGQVLVRLQQMQKAPPPNLPPGGSIVDVVRREYLAEHHRITGRNVILYASRWTQGGGDAFRTMMTLGDMDGFMNTIHGIEGDGLDLILHLPGGQAEAAERIGNYLRTRFKSIRVFVPLAAMSAATMLACVADEIVMGKHSCVGPIDPQFVLGTEGGGRAMPAYAILQQFEQAKKEILVNPGVTPAWIPILRQIDHGLLVQCAMHTQLARQFVGTWLSTYMLAGDPAKAQSAANALADHARFMSHSRYLDRNEVQAVGLKVLDLEADARLQDAVLSVYHATALTFASSPTANKIVENHKGAAWVLHSQQPQQLVVPIQFPTPVPLAPGQPIPSSPPPPPGLRQTLKAVLPRIVREIVATRLRRAAAGPPS